MNLTISEIKKLLKNWHFYKANVTALQENSELKRKLELIERAVSMLEDINREIITMYYFNRFTIETTASLVFMSVRGTYYRIDSAVKEIKYLVGNMA